MVAIAKFPTVAIYDKVSPDNFGAIFAQQQPAVLKGLVTHWPIVAAGRQSPQALMNYLKAKDVGLPISLMETPQSADGNFVYSDDLSGFNFRRREMSLGAALDCVHAKIARPGAGVAAIQMLPTQSHLPTFAADNASPLLPPQISPRLWVGGPMQTQIHNDGEHNIACVVAGRRRFVLFPPEEVGNLYIGPLDTPPALSVVRLESPDFAAYPKFQAALMSAREATLEPGDALFLPKYWWHHVSSLAPVNALVNYWWGAAGNGFESAFDSFQTALLAVRDLPEAEKAYWKAMFDTYVFKSGGDPVAHIPQDRQGTLGPMGPQMRDRLRKALFQAFLQS